MRSCGSSHVLDEDFTTFLRTFHLLLDETFFRGFRPNHPPTPLNVYAYSLHGGIRRISTWARPLAAHSSSVSAGALHSGQAGRRDEAWARPLPMSHSSMHAQWKRWPQRICRSRSPCSKSPRQTAHSSSAGAAAIDAGAAAAAAAPSEDDEPGATAFAAAPPLRVS